MPIIRTSPAGGISPTQIIEQRKARWQTLPRDVREHARIILQNALSTVLWVDIRNKYRRDPASFVDHHTFGQGIRNLLRSGRTVATDTLMPGIPDAQLPSGNWDDYYLAALAYAAGIEGY